MCEQDDEVVDEVADRVGAERAEGQLEERQQCNGEQQPHQADAQVVGGPAECAREPAPFEQIVGASAVEEAVDDPDECAGGQAADRHDECEC